MRTVDDEKLMAFVGKVIGDLGAIASGPLVVLGDRLGLYRAMADGEPVTAAELAQRTGTTERYVAEWLSAQAASGYVAYDGSGRFHLEAEQAVALTDESSPACVLGGFESFTAAAEIMPRLTEAFRTGVGVAWGEHNPSLFSGTARFFRPGYLANLVESWLPALDGMTERLDRGAKVADIGCGYGHSTTLMADAYPKSTFTGFDAHGPSIDAAAKLAAESGRSHHLDFRVATAKTFDGGPYDLICYFDCLHDMGDPAGALSHARSQLSSDGTVMIVEPMAGDELADNLHPLGRLFYSVSTLVCTPASLSEEVGTALGAQAGPARTQEIAERAGFSRFRKAAETPFNFVYELRP
ncbi:MAG TPA: methyltransferase domain-containing protein [Jatrophihabitans sp.]|jgi:2-polyprenyl-3-methyl-5-hydroxy-6-metoxy-1,4-benzoquinol methylase